MAWKPHPPHHGVGRPNLHLRPRGDSDAEEQGPVWLSVVVPAKDEAGCLPQLVEEIVRALRPVTTAARASAPKPAEFEVVVVDDGSRDQTPEVLSRLALEYPELRPIRLARNVGQSGALVAGFRAARGDWVATLDADLQNDPADLPRLWEALEGHDAVLGWRARRRDTWSRRVIGRCANRVRNAVLGQAIVDTGCSVRIVPRSLALRLPMFHGAHRFLGPLLLREGCRVAQVPVNHRPRAHGRSHYHLGNRSVQVIVDLLGVAWLLRRPVRYEVIALGEEVPVPAPAATAPVRPAFALEA